MDLNNRIKQFNAELLPLLEKHQLKFGAVPFFVQMENGAFGVLAKPQLFDDVKKEELTEA